MAEVRDGILRAWNAGAYTADVQLTGSLPVYMTGVTVSRGLPAAEMTLGRRCAIALFDDSSNPLTAVIFAVYV